MASKVGLTSAAREWLSPIEICKSAPEIPDISDGERIYKEADFLETG